MTPAQIGWVAGIIELRGYLSSHASAQTDHRLPTVAVTLPEVEGQPHPIIAWLCERTGVAPIPTGKGYNRNACGEHCPRPHVHVSSRYHRWIVGGAKAVVLLQAIRPLLVFRAEEVDQLLQSTRGQYKRAHLHEMAARGWPVDWAPGASA